MNDCLINNYKDFIKLYAFKSGRFIGKNMNKRKNSPEPLCMTSERAEKYISPIEMDHIKADIGRRIVEAFNYHPDSEIAFILKASCKAVSLFTEGEELPPTEILLEIQKATGTSLHWLLTGDGTKYPASTNPLIIAEEVVISGLA